MLRFFVYAMLALLVGAFLPVAMQNDPGYVLITFRNYSVETTLVVAVLGLLLILALLNLLLWVLKAPARLFQRK